MSEAKRSSSPSDPRAAPDPAARARGFAGLRLSQKIPLLVVLVALLSGAVVAVADYRDAAGELRQSVETKLMALMEARRVAVVDYLAEIRRDLRNQSRSPIIIEAFVGFKEGWGELGDAAPARLFELYVERNPYPQAGRKQMDQPGDGSRYSLVHQHFHPLLRDYAEQYGYRDILFLDDNGDVIYSVMKKADFAANAVTDADDVRGLAQVFGMVRTNPLATAEAFVDFGPHLSDVDRPTGFIAMPVYDDGDNRMGMLVFEIPVFRINRIMNVPAGMGQTGEAFIVGRDFTVRSDSRLATRSTIMKSRVDTEPVRAALDGRFGVTISTETVSEHREVDMLTAYAPLDFLQIRWAVIAQAELDEVFAPVHRMRNRAIVNGILLTMLVGMVGYLATRTIVTRPLAGLSGAVQQLTGGGRNEAIPSVDRADEIGDIARALTLYQESLKERDRNAARREKEAKAAEVRRRLAEAIEVISEGFILLDPVDRVVLVNSKFLEIHERSAHLLTPGSDFSAFLRHHAELGEFAEAQGDVEAFLTERLERMKSGETVESRMSGGRCMLVSRYRTEDGGTVWTCSDISDLKRREQALIESEERYRLLVDTLPDGVMLFDAGSVVFLNAAGRRILGVGVEDQIEDYRYVDFVHDAEQDFAEARIRDIFERGEDTPPTERRVHTLDGRDIFIEIAAVPFRRGSRLMGLAVFRDLTEAKQAEAEIERQREALHQSEKLTALGSLLAGVAHELNNPLSIVVAQTMLLEETSEDEQAVRRAVNIRTAADRCARIVKTFLAMARQQPPERGGVDINRLIDNALELTGYTLRSAGIQVEANLADGVPGVWGDVNQLHQVVANLFINAQQAMAESKGDRRLRVETGYDADTGLVRMIVEDTGPGIVPELRGRVFEPFYTTKPVGVGTGIGLSVCLGVVEAHGGRIDIEEAPGGGARFVVLLPSTVADIASSAQADAERPKPGRRRILIVDDEPDITESLAEILALDGHDVDQAHSGQAALGRIKKHDYDLILLDLRMPGLDGQALYRELQNSRPDLCSRIAVMTGDVLQASATEFLRETGLPLIEKPFVPADVYRAIVDLLPADRA